MLLKVLVLLSAFGLKPVQTALKPFVRVTSCGSEQLPGGAYVTLSGKGVYEFAAHESTSFRIDAFWGNGTAIKDAYFQIRAVGPVLIAGKVSFDRSHYIASYEIRDPGEYIIELRVSWLSGGDLYNQPLPLFTPEFLNKSVHVDCILYRGQIQPRTGPRSAGTGARWLSKSSRPNSKSQSKKPLCKDGSSPGRWVWVPPGEACPPDVCEGSAQSLSFLRDLFGFNTHWVWSPYDCNYRIFSISEFEQCLVNKSIHTIGFPGDSLLREHFQNLHVFLQQHLPETEKSWSSKSMNQFVHLTLPGGHKVNLHYVLDPGGKEFRHAPDREVNSLVYSAGVYDAIIFNAQLLRMMVTQIRTEKIQEMTQIHFMHPYRVISELRSRSFLDQLNTTNNGRVESHTTQKTVQYQSASQPLVYYLHPRIQREDVRIHRSELAGMKQPRKVEGFACMTPPRQDIATAAIRKQIKRLHSAGGLNRVVLLDGLQVSEARWESTWDGAHYSLLLNSKQLLHNATCPQFLPGGRHLCHHLRQYPGINRCPNGTEYNNNVNETSNRSNINDNNNNDSNSSGRKYSIRSSGHSSTAAMEPISCERMDWCRRVVDRSATFDHFEGGVSRMLTMMWMNMICN